MDDVLTMSFLPPFGRQQSSPRWARCAGGSKRKAHAANIDEEYDTGDGPAPPKQFLSEDFLANNKKDAHHPVDSAPRFVGQGIGDGDEYIVGEDEEMELAPESDKLESTFDKRNEISLESKSPCEAYGCNEDKEAASECYKSSESVVKPTSSSNSKTLRGISFVLSDEIQATLTRQRLHEDLILPKLLTDRVKQANSMALVVWKPPVNVALNSISSQMPPSVNMNVAAVEPRVNSTFMKFEPTFEPNFSIQAPLSTIEEPPDSPFILEENEDCCEMDTTP